jgi:Asp/Glu/hydantoin racemase
MKTVAAVHTSPAIVDPIKELFEEILPDCRLVNIVDDSLIQDVIRDGEVKLPVTRRLMRYYLACEDLEADAIFNTCSSIGEVASMARTMIRIPLIKIDEPMARRAVVLSDSIAVLATLPTTLAPTVRLVRSMAEQAGRKVQVVEGLAEGAFQALVGGDPARHDELLEKAAERVAEKSEVIVLAQASMARMEKSLAELTGKTVLSSPRAGVEEVKACLVGQS